MAQSLYISDLDGTLLRSDATLSRFSRDTLNRVIGEGAAFTVATARSVVSAAAMLRGLKLGLPIIEFNGAFISDLQTGRHEIINALPSAIAEDLYHLAAEDGCVPLISSFNGVEDCLHHPEATNKGMCWYLGDRARNNDRRLRPAGDPRHALAEQVVCLTIIDEAARLAGLEQAIQQRHGQGVVPYLIENLYSLAWHWLTSESGFKDVRRLDECFFQPVIIGRKAHHA